MRARIVVACMSLLGLLSVETAKAAVITFDDIPSANPCGETAVPNGYAGLNWTELHVLAADLCGGAVVSSGYDTGTVSEDFVAFNFFAGDASATGGTFTYNSAYYAGGWRDGLNLAVKGFLGVTELFAETLIVNTDVPLLHVANWAGIDRLTWQSFGGVDDPTLVPGSGTHFVMDNLTIDQRIVPAQIVPEPTSLLLLGTGVMGFVARRRRRKR